MSVTQVLLLCLGLVGAFVFLIIGGAVSFLYAKKKKDEIAAIDRLTAATVSANELAREILAASKKLEWADGIAVILPNLIDELLKLRNTIEDSSKSPDRLSEVTDKLIPIAAEFAKLPEFVNGHAKAAGAIAMQVAKLDQSVISFSNMLLDPTAQRNAVSQAREEDAAKAFEVTQVLLENPGLSMQAAMDQAEQNMLKRANLPQMSMD